MKKLIVIITLFFAFSVSTNAQTNSKEKPFKSEKQENNEANQLKRSIEENQLQKAPVSLGVSSKTDNLSKKSKCTKKKKCCKNS